VLTADLARVTKRNGELRLVTLSPQSRAKALSFAEYLLQTAQDQLGRTREELEEVWSALQVSVKEQKLLEGVKKLVLDRCTFNTGAELDVPALRQQVFLAPSAARAAADFNREQILAAVAAHHTMNVAQLESTLYADLPAAHRLEAVDAIDAAALIDRFDMSQAQAVLLKATWVALDIHASVPSAYRQLLRRIKFHRLLFTSERRSFDQNRPGYRVQLDGPLSLFSASTKYGLQLALVLPALQLCDDWRLRAQLKWGQRREPLSFQLSKSDIPGALPLPPLGLPDEVESLFQAFEGLKSEWKVARADEILECRGIGTCVPDLVFTRGGQRIHLEVLGYWSRDAVWKRVELVQKGLNQSVIFALSSRLRVSEEVLDDKLPSALYVYKGTMSAKVIAERLNQIAARS